LFSLVSLDEGKWWFTLDWHFLSEKSRKNCSKTQAILVLVSGKKGKF